jgi:hypothetical protein
MFIYHNSVVKKISLKDGKNFEICVVHSHARDIAASSFLLDAVSSCYI